MKIRLYHATTPERAGEIERQGFKDTENDDGCEGTLFRGVFFSDEPLDRRDGTSGSGAFFALDVDEAEVAPFKLRAECEGYRQWCIVNQKHPRRLVHR